MTTDARTTHIEADRELPTVRMTREFDAPPEKVFRAHVDPELFVRWIGPDGMSTRLDHFDCRTGGSYRYASVQGDEEYWFFGSFHEVRAPTVLVQTFTFEGFPDAVSLDRLELVDLGDGRTRLVATSLFDSFAGRDAMLASGMEVGVDDGYRKLDALLASLPA